MFLFWKFTPSNTIAIVYVMFHFLVEDNDLARLPRSSEKIDILKEVDTEDESACAIVAIELLISLFN